jgi:hypothetical protein
VSGYATRSDHEQVEKFGVTQFMCKPLTPEMIEQGAEEALQTTAAPIVEAKKEVAVDENSAVMTLVLAAAAPFLGLAFILGLPVIGSLLLAYFGFKAITSTKAKQIGLFLSAPFIGLASVVALPFVGIGAGLYYGVKAVTK